MTTSKSWCGNLRVWVVGGAMLALAAGCASPGYKKADAMADGMRDAAESFHLESRALDVAIAHLEELMTNPAPDPAPQFKDFSRSVDRLQSAARRADQSIRVMQERRAVYFNSWSQEVEAMNYGIIRERSEGRLGVVSNHVDAVLVKYEETQGVVRPMVAYLDDLRRALRADLTVEGLRAVQDIAANAVENARKVQQGLATVTVELGDSSSRLSRYLESRPDAELQSAAVPEGDHRRIR